MSEAYAAASRSLDTAARHHTGGHNDSAAVLAQIGTGRAILALTDEVEALHELLRERLPAPLPAPTSILIDQHNHPDGPRCAVCVVRELPHRRLERLAGGVDHPFTSDNDWPRP